MTKNRRYEAHFDALNDARIAEAAARGREPGTLPMQAYGPRALHWPQRGGQRPVWAWINWREGPATRIPATAVGWNDRVVIVEWWDDTGGQRSVAVWRTAVTHRTPHKR